jgi:hypothetical protein
MTTNVIVDNQHLITKVYFPRLILPICSALSGLVDFSIGFVVLAIFTIAYGIPPTLAALWLPALLALAVFTAFGVGLWLSALNALYRDVRYVIPFLIQFWMFASPVVYPSTLVPPRWRWLYGPTPWPVSLTVSAGPSPAARLPISFFSLPAPSSLSSCSAVSFSSIAWRAPLPIESSSALTLCLCGGTARCPHPTSAVEANDR